MFISFEDVHAIRIAFLFYEDISATGIPTDESVLLNTIKVGFFISGRSFYRNFSRIGRTMITRQVCYCLDVWSDDFTDEDDAAGEAHAAEARKTESSSDDGFL